MEIETDSRFQLRLLNEKDAAGMLALDLRNRVFLKRQQQHGKGHTIRWNSM